MAKVKRSTQGVRRSAAAHNRSQKARAAKRHTSGLLDRAMAALPFTEEQWHRFFLVAIIAAGAAIAWTIAACSAFAASERPCTRIVVGPSNAIASCRTLSVFRR